MPNYTEKLGQRFNLVGYIAPVSQAAGTVLTAAIDMSKHRRVIFVIGDGVLGASATVDFSITQSATSGGSYVAISPAKAITQLVKASNDGSIAMIEIAAEELTSGQRFVKGNLVVGTAASLMTVFAIAADDRYHPAADNLAAVVQVV